jgi:hypothetical protein
MGTLIAWLIVLIAALLVFCVFELMDAWEEYDFYNGYIEWHESLISSDGDQPVYLPDDGTEYHMDDSLEGWDGLPQHKED